MKPYKFRTALITTSILILILIEMSVWGAEESGSRLIFECATANANLNARIQLNESGSLFLITTENKKKTTCEMDIAQVELDSKNPTPVATIFLESKKCLPLESKITKKLLKKPVLVATHPLKTDKEAITLEWVKNIKPKDCKILKLDLIALRKTAENWTKTQINMKNPS